VRLVVFEVRWRRTLRRHASIGGGPVTILDVPDTLAFSSSGGAGTVVVSRGLLNLLSAPEQAALFAHERCHLQRRHHRFLRASGLAAAMVPPLVVMSRHVRFATEREADETAAKDVGDRRIVARAIAIAAVGGRVGAGAPAMAMADHAVTARVEELLSPRQPSWALAAAVTAALAIAIVELSTSTIQLHHLVAFAAHVCGLDGPPL